MKDGRVLVGLAAVASGLVLALAAPGGATVRMRDEAKELGYPADDCAYCHTFTHEHMTRHAREAGLRSTNCIVCHGAALPLDGVDLYNARGRFLIDAKKERGARRADMRWLADYVEEDEDGGARDEGEAAGSDPGP